MTNKRRLAISGLLLLGALAFSGTVHAQTHPLGESSPISFTSGGSANCQRGWTFTANSSAINVTQLGCYYPDSSTQSKTLTLFDATTHAVLAQVSTTPGAGWIWENLASPVQLTSGQTYAVVGHSVSSSYYYQCDIVAPSPWLPTGDIDFGNMVYCNSCSAGTWPSSSLTNNCQYGVVDIGYTTNCGNSTVDPGEDCDEGVNNGTTDCGCQSDCTWDEAGTPCGDSSETECDEADTCDGAGVCGENNVADGTACTSDELFCNGTEECSLGECSSPGNPCDESSQSCDEYSNSCEPLCGNGVLDPDEECDDENIIADDGCTDCLEDDGWTCDDSEPSQCEEESEDSDDDDDDDDDSEDREITHSNCSCEVPGVAADRGLLGTLSSLL